MDLGRKAINGRAGSGFALLALLSMLPGCSQKTEQLAGAHQATFDQFCTDCHNPADLEAGLSLASLELDNVARDAAVFEEVIRKLRGGLMPPSGRPRPDAETVDELVSFLETSLDEAAAENPDPGTTSIHRLNRAEYGNAVRDLLGLNIDPGEYLPADDEGYGFDNIADILRVSPSLLEQYLSGSSVIAGLAVGDPQTPTVNRVFRVPPDMARGRHVEGLPLGTRDGVLIRHNFPLDAEYDFAVFLMRNIVGYMTGLEWEHELEITIDGERVFAAHVGGEEDNAMSDANFSAAGNAIDERLRTRVFVEAGPHDVGIAFVNRNSAQTHEPLELHTRDHDLQNMNGLPVVDYFIILGPHNATGPGDTPSRRQIFTCHPDAGADADECAREILSGLARRAFRRPVETADVDLLFASYENGRSRGGFEAGIQNGLRVLLASPDFLFRSEPDPEGVAPGSVYAVDDWALASRLSFFLWSSLPDDELLDLAAAGQLSDSAVLEAQVARMIADPRADALVENFAGQWLFLRNLQSARPNIETFPDFDENLRRAMRQETELFFSHILREDRSVLELLTADYTFLNERLAEHYQIKGVYGSHFRQVELPDARRRGLLGHGSILTVTSYPNRTSPVLRGKWVLENIIGTPPPAPPPDVPALDENEAGHTARSVRERLAEHRENPVCASCHDVMDPLGLGLENFDAIGRWRVREPGGRVDASGSLADGLQFEGPVELREALMREPEQFVGVLAEKLLIYALGRGLEAEDMPTVRGIVRAAAADDYRFSSVIEGVVSSVAFRMKRAREDAI